MIQKKEDEETPISVILFALAFCLMTVFGGIYLGWHDCKHPVLHHDKCDILMGLACKVVEWVK